MKDDKENILTFTLSSSEKPLILTATSPEFFMIRCGKGFIEINLKNGNVKLPRNMPYDEAAIAFWNEVQKQFPVKN